MSNSGQGEEQQQSSGILPPAEHLESVEAVFRAFDPANPLWGAGRVGSWVFRGESKAHELKPSAWRKETLKHPNWAYSLKLAGDYAEKWMRQCFEKLPPIAHRLSRQKDDDNKRSLREWATQLVTQIHWERLLQDRFVELADELGIDVAMGGPQFPADARHYPFHRDKLISPQPEQATAFAQHHGIPTKLLDWTRNPYVALYWAAESHLRCRTPQGSFVVWALNLRTLRQLATTYWEDHNKRENPGVLYFNARRAGHSYLHAQDGLFTWIHGWEASFLDSGRFPTLQWAIAQLHRAEAARLSDPDKPILQRLEVPATYAKAVLDRLQRWRITRYKLMPTLDNVRQGMEDESWLPAPDLDYIPATEPECG